MQTATACARLLTEHKDAIISEWEAEVRQKIIAAGMSDSVALQNHLPELIDDIAEIFIEKEDKGFDHKIDKYPSTLEKNKIHGKLRAETENYTIDQVILEYFILHRIITEFLEKHGLLSVDIVNLLKYILERTVMQASSAFTLSVQETQDKLIGTLAHDMRNPLTVALTGLELLVENPEKVESLIPMIRKSLLRSIHLTEGLLDSISLKAGHGILMDFRKEDFAVVVKEACDETREIYSKEVVCQVPERVVEGNFDSVAIRRMIDNLISNAIKYGGPDSMVKITLSETDEEVCLSVHNEGKPIPDEKQKTIFEFLNHDDVETTPSMKSWGMGLTLVKLIAEAHDGAIDLTSTQEQGTTFKVTLKRHLEHSGKVRMKSKITQKEPGVH